MWMRGKGYVPVQKWEEGATTSQAPTTTTTTSTKQPDISDNTELQRAATRRAVERRGSADVILRRGSSPDGLSANKQEQGRDVKDDTDLQRAAAARAERRGSNLSNDLGAGHNPGRRGSGDVIIKRGGSPALPRRGSDGMITRLGSSLSGQAALDEDGD
jgi:hypothetical protein